MKKVLAATALAGLLFAAAPASAQSHWTAVGAETVAPGGDMVHGAFGWPDVTLGYTHGMSNNFDLGGRLQFIYGVEGRTDTQFGMAFAVPLRWTFLRHNNVSLMFHVDPGLRFYTYSQFQFGFQLLPFGVNFEVRPITALHLGVGFDFMSNLFVTGGGTPAYSFGPMAGPFFEYHIDPHIALGLDTRFGANIVAGDFPGSPHSAFAFRAQMVLAYRM